VRGLAALALLTLLLPWVPLRAAAQAGESFELRKVERLHLDDIDAGRDGERAVELYVRALTRYGEPVGEQGELRPVDLAIRDAEERIDPEDVEITTLAKSGRGVTCVIAIDASRTMQGEPFERARAAALELVALLEPQDRVAVVAISEQARVVSGFSASQAAARLELERLEVDGEALRTLLYDGVHQAVDLLRQTSSLPRRAFAIVFSDGKDGGSQRTLDEVIAFAKGDERRSPALVFTIGYARFGGEGLASLERLARETNADFLQATSTIHLSSFFAEIWKQMKGSYVVRYPGDLDGEIHNVEISIDGQTAKRSARYPAIGGPSSPYWLVVGAVALVALLALLLLLRGRSAGRLVFRNGPLAGSAVPLRRGVTRIGAIPENNDVVLQSHTVSRYHAVVHRRGRRVEIEDLNSTNGTFVNGAPVRASPLRPGDKVRIADVDLVYER
jgi:hypothetical protein